MNRALLAEFRKLLTTPSSRWLAVGAVVFAAITIVAGPSPTPQLMALPLPEREFVLIGSMWRVLVALIGVRIVTDEYHHGTIVPTLVTMPRRATVVAAKAAVAAGTGALVGLAASGALISLAVATGRVDTAAVGFGGHVVAMVVGSTAAGALWASLGVGVGFVVRHPVAATVGTVVWMLGVEDLVRLQLGTFGGYLPSQAGIALAIVPSWSLAGRSALVLTGYAAAVLVGATLLARRRDVA